MKWHLVAVVLALCGYVTGVRDADLEVELGKVKETRINDQTSALSIELIGGGEMIHLVRAAIFHIENATDDTGHRLLMKGKPKIVWAVNLMRRDRDKAGAWLHLMSPSRQATMLKEFSGTIDFVLPSRDPSSVVTVKDLIKQSGKPVDAPQIKQAGASVMLWLKREFDIA